MWKREYIFSLDRMEEFGEELDPQETNLNDREVCRLLLDHLQSFCHPRVESDQQAEVRRMRVAWLRRFESPDEVMAS